MTQPAGEAVRDAATDSVTFAFGDTAARIYGLARLELSRGQDSARQASALAVVFAGRAPVAALARGGLPVGPDAGWDALELAGLRATVEEPFERWSVSLDTSDGQGFELEFSALGAAASLPADAPAGRLGGMAGYDQPCRVRGTTRARGRRHAIDGLGQRGHSWGYADWERIELARSVTAWTDSACAALTAIRPAGARHHAAEATWAALWEPEPDAATSRQRRYMVEVEDGRLSTTYDADGHTRRAGLELWAPGAEWPRRASGEVVCGSSLDLGALRLDCSFFNWRLEGRSGVGRYDVLRRAA